MARFNAALALALASVVVAACDNGSEPTSAVSAPSAAVVPAEQATDPMVVSQRINGFGGMFLDEAGRPTVYLTDMSEATRARSILRGFAEENGSSHLDIRFIQAKYRINDLAAWYNRSWPEVMSLAGTNFTDLDEANNRILFGVQNAGLRTAIAAVMRAQGVPASAYAVEVTEPMRNLATLRDVVNPKTGALQIHFTQYLCTLGFNYTMGGVNGFITNSHCTAKQGGVENTVYYQPSSSLSGAIATEVADPVYTRTGCPKGKVCRYSDSSRAVYNAGVAFDLGGISATNGTNLTITGLHNITSEIDANRTPVAVGQSVSKTGRTTGTSTGNVTNTCVNTGVQGTKIVQLCQTFVAANVGSGDSGSPVYSGSGNVALVGILWGGGTGTFAFSPLRSIKDELGNFAAH